MLFRLLDTALKNQMDFEEKVRLKILNAVILTYLAINGFFVLYNLLYSQIFKASLLQISFLLLTLPIYYLVIKKRYNAAKFILFSLLNIQMFITSMYILPGRGVEYFYIVVIILFLILVRNNRLLFWVVTLDIFLFLTPQLTIHPYPAENYSYINAIVILITVISSLQYFIVIQNGYKERLKSQKEKLEKLNIEKNDLMSIVAHDLKTPLAQIEGLVSILEYEDTQLKEEQKQVINQIKSITDDHKNQITGYLKVQSVEDSIESTSLENVDVNEIILQVWNEMLPLAKAKNINLTSTYDNRITVEGNKEGLYKILANLVSNAIKYSNHNTEISMSAKSVQDQALIIVRDQGPGFSKEDLPNVFKKHSVLSATPTHNETSTGLGLYIVKRYVDRMNGHIWLESEKGEGTTFFIKIPLA